MSRKTDQQNIERFEPKDVHCPVDRFDPELKAQMQEEERTASARISQFKAVQQADSSFAKLQKKNEAMRYEPIELMPNNKSHLLLSQSTNADSLQSKSVDTSSKQDTLPNDADNLNSNTTKGLINVSPPISHGPHRHHGTHNVRVTTEKAAKAHQDYSVPEANASCVAPDINSARQALQQQRSLKAHSENMLEHTNNTVENAEQASASEPTSSITSLEDLVTHSAQARSLNKKSRAKKSQVSAANKASATRPVDEIPYQHEPYLVYPQKSPQAKSIEDDDFIEPFAELESTHNAIYMPQPCSFIHKLSEEEMQEEAAKDQAYERALHRAVLRTEMDEATLRKNPMLMSLLTNSDAARRLLPAGHHPNAHPKKDLIENVKHGTSIFPFACYIWVPQNYSYRVALHWHPEVELVRFNQGLFKISIDMQDTIIEDHAFMLLPGNIMHTFTMPPNCEESALVFDPNMLFLQNYDEVQSEILEALSTGNMPLPPIITPEHPCFARIDSLYNYCVEHGSTTNSSHRLMIKAKLLEILAIYHEYGLISRKEVHTNIKRSKQDKLKELLNYIDSHYAGPITIKDASSRMGVTDQYFCRFFKRVTGMSFTEYLNDLRLRRAAKEIELTNRPISDIAYEHGFENVGYFFKSFKSKFSLTPLKYRKKHLASLPH